MAKSTNTKMEIKNIQNIAVPLKIESLVIPLQEKWVMHFRINPWLSWLIIGEVLGGAAYLAVLLSHGVMMWIGQLAIMYSIVVMIAGAGPVWVRDELEKIL